MRFANPPKRLTLYLAGSEEGPPTLDDLLALTKALTGRDPTPQEIEKARAILDRRSTKS